MDVNRVISKNQRIKEREKSHQESIFFSFFLFSSRYYGHPFSIIIIMMMIVSWKKNLFISRKISLCLFSNPKKYSFHEFFLLCFVCHARLIWSVSNDKIFKNNNNNDKKSKKNKQSEICVIELNQESRIEKKPTRFDVCLRMYHIDVIKIDLTKIHDVCVFVCLTKKNFFR